MQFVSIMWIRLIIVTFHFEETHTSKCNDLEQVLVKSLVLVSCFGLKNQFCLCVVVSSCASSFSKSETLFPLRSTWFHNPGGLLMQGGVKLVWL